MVGALLLRLDRQSLNRHWKRQADVVAVLDVALTIGHAVEHVAARRSA
jgi:hypothetical protein